MSGVPYKSTDREDPRPVVSQRVRQARKIAGLKQSELADLVGVSQMAIGAVERGKNVPSVATLILIAKRLNVSADFLCGLKPLSREYWK